MLSELMDKLARGRTLNALEVSQLRDEFRALEEVKNLAKGWVVQGTQQPIFIPPMSVIYSEVLDQNKASIDIAIPPNYKHLLIMGSGRTDSSSGYIEGCMIRFNGDTGSNYMHTGDGRLDNVASGYQNTSNTSAFIGAFNTANAIANSSGAFFAPVHNIRSSFWKTFSTIYGTSNAGASASLYTIVNFGTWKSTASVSSVTLLTETGSNILSGSVISVYGIL